MAILIFACFSEGFLAFLGFNIVIKLINYSKYINFILIISLIVYIVYNLFFKKNDKNANSISKFVLLK